MLFKLLFWSHPEKSLLATQQEKLHSSVIFLRTVYCHTLIKSQLASAVVLVRSALQRGAPGHVNELISWRDQQALLHIHDNALRCSSRWQTPCDSQGIFVEACGFFFPFPALGACVGLAGSLLLDKNSFPSNSQYCSASLTRGVCKLLSICSGGSPCSRVHVGRLSWARRF